MRIFPGNSNHLVDKDLVNLSYQNPETLPFREFYNSENQEMVIHHPETRIKYQIRNLETHADGLPQDPESISWYRLNSRQNAYGHFYKFTHV